MNFAARCAIATGCLARADYRAKLEALHAEMLAAIADERERCACVAESWSDYRRAPVSIGPRIAAAIRDAA